MGWPFVGPDMPWRIGTYTFTIMAGVWADKDGGGQNMF